MANHIRFFAITAADVERARRFYESVFGWTFEDWGPPGFYIIQGAGLPGALQGRHEPLVGTHPRSFELTVGVDDLDGIIAKVRAAGGAIVMDKSHIETVGTLIHFTDTEGNRMGAMKYESAQ
ncbi:MAG TPA: VOC family protein [Rhizomicrobium sp.]|nr:VOC family protein [Rhizomicrobium sp.]